MTGVGEQETFELSNDWWRLLLLFFCISAGAFMSAAAEAEQKNKYILQRSDTTLYLEYQYVTSYKQVLCWVSKFALLTKVSPLCMNKTIFFMSAVVNCCLFLTPPKFLQRKKNLLLALSINLGNFLRTSKQEEKLRHRRK